MPTQIINTREMQCIVGHKLHGGLEFHSTTFMQYLPVKWQRQEMPGEEVRFSNVQVLVFMGNTAWAGVSLDCIIYNYCT